MTEEQMPAGWYPDPDVDGARDRYWDGEDWTDDTRPYVEPQARRRRGLRTPGDLLVWGAYALLAGVLVTLVNLVLVVLGVDDSVTGALETISGTLGIVLVAFVVAAAVAKIIQIGVSSARDDS